MHSLPNELRLKLYQQIVEMAPNAMILIASDGKIEMVNAQAEIIFAYPREELLGQSIDLLLPASLREQHDHHRQAYLSHSVSRMMGSGRDLYARRKDGTEFPVEIGLNPIPTDSGMKILSAIVDISERKVAEKRQQKMYVELQRINEELNNFAYVSSHDLKSPLRGIDQLANWIEEDLAGTVSEETQTHLRLMRSRIHRMERLLDDLLAYSRVGHSIDDVVEVNTQEMVLDIFDLMSNIKPIQLKIVGNLPEIHTRKVPLELILRNLIGNAIKHHDKTSGEIQVSAEINHDWIEFCVADDGAGIAPKHQQRIFGMFQTLKSRDEVEGSGIGLALVKKAVESIDGAVRVVSDGQRGCRFYFTWPVKM